MLLSFSVPTMLPMIEMGLRQREGQAVAGARVKRQTIRRRGPRGAALIERARADGWRCPCPLHLWWKSRTKERAFIGKVEGAECKPLLIVRSQLPRGPILIGGEAFKGDHVAYATFLPEEPNMTADAFARADGFDSVEAFRDFFVPKPGDVFEGVLFSW